MGRDLGRRAAAEALGTGLLLAVVVGSGVMAARLSPENMGVALLANAVATGAGFFASGSASIFTGIFSIHLNHATQ